MDTDDVDRDEISSSFRLAAVTVFFFSPHPTPSSEMCISQLLKMADISKDLLPVTKSVLTRFKKQCLQLHN